MIIVESTDQFGTLSAALIAKYRLSPVGTLNFTESVRLGIEGIGILGTCLQTAQLLISESGVFAYRNEYKLAATLSGGSMGAVQRIVTGVAAFT